MWCFESITDDTPETGYSVIFNYEFDEYYAHHYCAIELIKLLVDSLKLPLGLE